MQIACAHLTWDWPSEFSSFNKVLGERKMRICIYALSKFEA